MRITPALDGLEIALPERNEDELIQVNDALDKLALTFPKKAELVKLRYLSGSPSRKPLPSSGSLSPQPRNGGPTRAPGSRWRSNSKTIRLAETSRSVVQIT